MTEPTPSPLAWPAVAGGLIGALGVVLAALAAHVDASHLVQAASQIALAHAPLLVALSLPGVRGVIRRPAIPALTVTVGVVLFCGDMVARVFFGFSLFTNAAPLGGSLLILGWFLIAGFALPTLFVRHPTR